MKLGITSGAPESFSGRDESRLLRDSGVREKAKRRSADVESGAELGREEYSGVFERPSTYAGVMYNLIGNKRRALSDERRHLLSRLESLVDFKSAIGKVKNVTDLVVDVSQEDEAYREVRDRLAVVNGQLEILRLKEEEVAMESENDPEVRARQARGLIVLQGKMLDLEREYGMLDLHEEVPLPDRGREREAGFGENPFESAA